MPGPQVPRPQRGVALYPFIAEAANELSLQPGEPLLVYYRVDNRWLFVRKEGTRLSGYVPFLYCKLAPNSVPSAPSTRHTGPDDTSSLSSLASLSDSGLPSPTSSTSTGGDLAPPLPLRTGPTCDPRLHPASLQDSFDSGISSLRSSGRGEVCSIQHAPPRPPRPPVRTPLPATCLRSSPHDRGAKKKQVTFSSSAPQVFLTPKYTVMRTDSSEDIVDLDELLSRDSVTSPSPTPPPPPLLASGMELYETFVSAVDANGDIETVTLV